MKKHRNLLDLYYENTAKVDYESAFIYSTNFSLSYKETEMLTKPAKELQVAAPPGKKNQATKLPRVNQNHHPKTA